MCHGSMFNKSIFRFEVQFRFYDQLDSGSQTRNRGFESHYGNFFFLHFSKLLRLLWPYLVIRSKNGFRKHCSVIYWQSFLIFIYLAGWDSNPRPLGCKFIYLTTYELYQKMVLVNIDQWPIVYLDLNKLTHPERGSNPGPLGYKLQIWRISSF